MQHHVGAENERRATRPRELRLDPKAAGLSTSEQSPSWMTICGLCVVYACVASCAAETHTRQAPTPTVARAVPAMSVDSRAGENANSAPVTRPAESETTASPANPGPEERLARYQALWRSARFHPSALDEAPRKASISPGNYACRVSQEYRLRACTVELDAEGRTFLIVSEGNLIAMRGLLYDNGNKLEFEGWLSEEQPFGCTSCQDRCIMDPSSCSCDPLPEEAVVECLRQPLRMTFRPNGKGGYSATLPYSVYYNEYTGEGAGRHAKDYVGKSELYRVDLVRDAPPSSKPRR